MGRIVIAAYRPKAGKSSELEALTREHWGVLAQQELVTERRPIIMTARDGTVIEVFEWRSKAAMEAAHSNEKVLALWQRYGAACDFVPVGDIEEAGALFSEFEPFA